MEVQRALRALPPLDKKQNMIDFWSADRRPTNKKQRTMVQVQNGITTSILSNSMSVLEYIILGTLYVGKVWFETLTKKQ